MRLAMVLALAAALAACDAPQGPQAQQGPFGPGQDPHQQVAEFARGQGQQLQNPYCAIPTYRNDTVPYRGFAMNGPNGPVIYIRGDGMQDQNLYRFILAHECGHHAHRHPDSWPESAEANAQRELQADCWGAQTIAGQLDSMALQAAFLDAQTQGPFGQQRISMIQQCAAGQSQGQNPNMPMQPTPMPQQQQPYRSGY